MGVGERVILLGVGCSVEENGFAVRWFFENCCVLGIVLYSEASM